MRIPIYSHRVKRGDWILTILVGVVLVSLALALGVTLAGRALDEQVSSLLQWITGSAFAAYVGKSWPERGSAVTGEEGAGRD